MKHYENYEVPHYHSLLELLLYSKSKYGNETTFMNKSHNWTYQSFFQSILVAAGCLKKVRRQYVLIDTDDVFEFAVAFFSIIITDNIAVLHHSEMSDLEEPFRNLKFYVSMNHEFFKRLTHDSIHIKELPPTDIEATCAILCSSGTTSLKKGICLSQKNLCSCVEGGLQKFLYQKQARYVNLIPLSHAFGLIADLLCPLYTGGTICMPDSKLHFYSELPYFKPDALNLPPNAIKGLLDFIDMSGSVNKVTGGNLRKILCAGAPLPHQLYERAKKHHILVLEAYGLTECSPCISINRDLDYKVGSVGLPIDCLSIKIASDEEILVKGDNVMNGYLNDVESTNRVIKDGWLYTGDLGYIDHDGFLYITGRKNNMILFDDGTKCMPESIENLFNQYDMIQETCITKWENGFCATIVMADEVASDRIDTIVSMVNQMLGQHKIIKLQLSKVLLERTELGKIKRGDESI